MRTKAHESAAAILETMPMVTRAVRAQVAEYVGSGTTLPQFRVLTHLNRSSRCLSDLAARQHVSLATMSKIVSGLVDRGYVERGPESRDRRYITLRLTPKGQRFFDKAYAHTHAKIVERLAALSNEEHKRLVDGLGVLASVFEESEYRRQTPAGKGDVVGKSLAEGRKNG